MERVHYEREAEFQALNSTTFQGTFGASVWYASLSEELPLLETEHRALNSTK